ncbi:hypothetical protein [Paenibacillus crassostreae]|uniref:DUF2334 domain-containing protein n=1 Tax=Paenibacillus crassostreae TaxID=1763538 RepID=A0A167FGX3_9BACL|nr:hypothetical protein [Paenibacillus crassostreae]AOZ94416.1 hypothetical protein LPB68_20885 [Paenibacillus crassostreae]OAB76548.1 hypothetical protein PNBC_03855 [Paenibacillus crassostreae]
MYITKIVKIWMVFLALFIGLPSSNLSAQDHDSTHVLFLYDSWGVGTSKEGNVESLQKLLASYGVKVTSMSFDDYNQGELAQYNKVIGLRNVDDLPLTNKDFNNDFEKYTGDYFHIGSAISTQLQEEMNLQIEFVGEQVIHISIGQFSESRIQAKNMSYIMQAEGTHYGSITPVSGKIESPFGVQNEHYGYVPYYEKGNMSELALAYVLKDWLNVTEEGQTYLVFKEIYPFSDLELLAEMSFELYDAGIPFMVSISPVFSNTDYPAMKRYLETLKYVQSHNGTIIVNAPFVLSTASQNEATLQSQMASFIDILADNGIAPLSIGAEIYWSQADTSRSFESSTYSVSPFIVQQFEHSAMNKYKLPMNSAVAYDFTDQREDLHKIVQTLIDSWMMFADYKYESHIVQTKANIISSQNGILTINGNAVDINNSPQLVDSEFNYGQVEQKSFETLFQVQNTIFMFLIVVTLIVFGFLFIIGRRLYRRKYINQRRNL